LAKEGKLLHSVKAIRDATGMSLSDAKHIAERWQRGDTVAPSELTKQTNAAAVMKNPPRGPLRLATGNRRTGAFIALAVGIVGAYLAAYAMPDVGPPFFVLATVGAAFCLLGDRRSGDGYVRPS
jgi:hypothetical protein